MSYFKPHWDRKAKQISRTLQGSQQAALAEIEKLFPVGALVFVELGKSRITLRVERHGSFWSDPTTVYGVNVETGKGRRFYAGTDKVLRVDPPRRAAKP
jgi:hypothetical protein